MPSRVRCFNGTCEPSRDGTVCIHCGRTLRTLVEVLATGVPLESDAPNYWVHLMHDLEVIAEPIERPTNAALGFYGKRPNRMAS